MPCWARPGASFWRPQPQGPLPHPLPLPFPTSHPVASWTTLVEKPNDACFPPPTLTSCFLPPLSYVTIYNRLLSCRVRWTGLNTTSLEQCLNYSPPGIHQCQVRFTTWERLSQACAEIEQFLAPGPNTVPPTPSQESILKYLSILIKEWHGIKIHIHTCSQKKKKKVLLC